MARKTNLKLVEPVSKPLTAVQKRAANNALVDAKDWNEEQQFLEDLRGELWGRGGGIGQTWTQIGKDTKLAPSTISNFATGHVKKPSIFTVRRIARYFGYVMTFVKYSGK